MTSVLYPGKVVDAYFRMRSSGGYRFVNRSLFPNGKMSDAKYAVETVAKIRAREC